MYNPERKMPTWNKQHRAIQKEAQRAIVSD